MAAGRDQEIKLLREILAKIKDFEDSVLVQIDSDAANRYGDVKIIEVPNAGLEFVAVGAYAAGDWLGDTGPDATITLDDAMRVDNGTGYFVSIKIHDFDKLKKPIDVIICDFPLTGAVDNQPADPDSNDDVCILGHVSIVAADYIEFVGEAMATKTILNLPVQAYISEGKKLYAYLIIREAATYTAGKGISLKFGFDRN